MTAPLGLEKTLRSGFDEALVRVPAALQAEGFGVLTEIDVQATLKKKLNADFRRYRILGACNPPFAFQALSADLHAGLLMPCNVIIYETDDGHATVIATDPAQSVAAIGNDALNDLAAELKIKLSRALDAVE